MGLGFDFNPSVAMFRATKPPPREPKKGLVPAKPLRVQESRFPAAEAKPPTRSTATRASEEAIVKAKRVHAAVSRPIPSVRWIIPGLDNPDGRAHPPPASAGTIDAEGAEDEMREARQDALEAYEAHMDAMEAATTRTNWEHKQRAADFDRANPSESPAELTAREARATVTRKAASREAENLGRVTHRGTMAHAGANLRQRAPESGPAPSASPAPVRQSARNAREDGPAPAAAKE